MPFDGNGVFSYTSTTVTPAVTATTIDASEFNTFTADVATALNLCVVSNQTANPILLNPKILTTILDTNGNELVDFGTTGSAANNIRVTNATTGNSAKIDVTETNTNLELDGNGTGFVTTDKLAATTTNGDLALAGNGTGTVTTDSLSATTTNGDLALTGNGTGTVTVDGNAIPLQKILEIGTWDMDANAQSSAVAHGLTLANIRAIQVTIREDADLHFYDFAAFDNDSGSTSSFVRADATNINLQRAAGGVFDGTSFDTVGGDGNRGWILIHYV